jgi:hypothetical protein
MELSNDVVAAWAAVLVGPALLFVAALFLRQVPPSGSGPARTADRIVKWYAAHPQLALWVLLLLLPFTAFVLGSTTLMQTWVTNPQLHRYAWRVLAEMQEHWPTLSIGAATLVAFGMLVMVTSHLITGLPRSRRSITS